MENLSMFMLFDSMQQTEQGCQLINPLPIIQPMSVPGNFSFIFAFNAFGVKPGYEHTLSLSLNPPTGEPLTLFDRKKVVPNEPDNVAKVPVREDLPGSISINLELRNFPFKEEGIYTFKIMVDDKFYEHSFPVYHKDVY